MADKEFLLGVRARELLKYTKQATKIASDDVSQNDVRQILKRIAALQDIREVQTVTSQVAAALERNRREGFTKSTFRLYGEDMRFIAKQILLDVHAANNTNNVWNVNSNGNYNNNNASNTYGIRPALMERPGQVPRKGESSATI